MNRLLKIIPVLIFVFFVGSAIGINARTEEVNDKIVRFHIVADSNNKEAQDVKWEIRKKIFEEMDLKDINSKEDALSYFENEKENIRNIANEIIKKNGFSYGCEVNIGKKYLPVRVYDSFVLPSGIYDAVCVDLGSAKGENFFCVMYPSLCMLNSKTQSKEAFEMVFDDSETRLLTDVSKKTVIKFKLAEMIEGFMSN